jgi:RNAse (barnase) inhibitor barstar
MCTFGEQIIKTTITPLLIDQGGTNYTQEYTTYPLPSGEERKEYENLRKITSFHREHKNCFVLPNRIVEYLDNIWYLIEFNIIPNKIRIPILEACDNRKNTHYLSKYIGFKIHFQYRCFLRNVSLTILNKTAHGVVCHAVSRQYHQTG